MPSEKQPFYDPVPPSYDEALAGGSRRDSTSADDPTHQHDESLSLLQRSDGHPASSRPPRGYQQPTAESDEEDSLFGGLVSDDEEGEADQVRREMQAMEIEEPSSSLSSSLWSKRIGLLSLRNWTRNLSWRPRLPRIRIQLPSFPTETSPPESQGDEDNDESSAAARGRSRLLPNINPMMAVINVARLIAIMIILWFVYILFAGKMFAGFGGRLNGGYRFNIDELKEYLQRSVDPTRLRNSVEHFTKYAHIAGTEGDYATAMDMESMFKNAGLEDIYMDTYHVYVNYPRQDGRAVQIMDQSGNKPIWSAKLEEEDRGKESAGRQTYAFHGHSKAGDVKGSLIYANYGSRDDYSKLKEMGINTDGAIALVRYYGSQTDRALKVRGAELAGFAGCIIYSDPADDGFLKCNAAPDGPCMPSDGVQRGAVSLMSHMVGDVLTPGWASREGLPRMKVNATAGLVGIPSLPLAWRDAQVLLQSLSGHGKKVPDEWKGGVPDVGEWWTGDSSSPIVRLQNEQDENELQPIWNVYGKIIGMESAANSIILGNHRDAWSFGATDPHTGTAIMLELACIFGDLVSQGWRPLRTIEFMSWDAEEYNLIGSTEFVEDNLERLRTNAFAYINLDTAVSGTELRAAGSPVFEKSLYFALDRVVDPSTNKTLQEMWQGRGASLEGLGAGSDYVAFQDISGTSSLDLQFGGGVFPYHSSYDNFELVDRFVDPGFIYHKLLTQVVGLIMLDLSDQNILPFEMTSYARRLEEWIFDLEKWALDQGSPADGSLSFQGLKDAAQVVKKNAEEFSQWELRWDEAIMAGGGWETSEVGEMRLEYNSRMAAFETALLDLEMGGGVSGSFHGPQSLDSLKGSLGLGPPSPSHQLSLFFSFLFSY